ncbi:hypothetical protein ACQ4WP_27490 [Janthinobacterium sp. GB4P2]|uniref:hypothetical protein n=1 Tax=Janthinobacterium sp. GB4P2 TaxID=3424189 RepID=UPI003F236CF2
MKIKMLKTIHGSTDGATVVELVVGTEYTMTDAARGERRAAAYIRRGDAIAAKDVASGVSLAPAPALRKVRVKK